MIDIILSTIEDDAQRNELNEIYAENEKQFLRLAYKMLKNKDNAEDAVQEAFLRIANNPDNLFAVITNKRVAYINSIIKNVCYEMFVKGEKRQENEIDLLYDISDDERLLDEKIINKVFVENALDYIEGMSVKMKEVLVLRVYFDMNISMIAKQLEISEDAVKKRLSRATQELKRHFGGNSNE